MNDPFKPKSDQLVREAKIGLTIVALLIALFCYVTWNRISGGWDTLPEHVLNAPVAQNMNEEYRETQRRAMAKMDRRLDYLSDRGQNDLVDNSRATARQLEKSLQPIERTFTRGVAEPANEGSVIVSKRTDDQSLPISVNALRSAAPSPSNELAQPSSSQKEIEKVGFQEPANDTAFDDPFGKAEPTGAPVIPGGNSDYQMSESTNQFVPARLSTQEASEFKPNVPDRTKSHDFQNSQNQDFQSQPKTEDKSTGLMPLNRRLSLSNPDTPGAIGQRTRFQVQVEPERPEDIQSVDIAKNRNSVVSNMKNLVNDPMNLKQSVQPVEHSQSKPLIDTTFATTPREFPVKPLEVAKSPTGFPAANHAKDHEVPTTPSNPESSVDQEPGYYVIQSDDESFWTIAEKVYGDGRLFRAVYEMNRGSISDPNRPEAGKKLRTPEIQELVQQWSEFVPEDLLPESPVDESRYVTQQGDSLFGIAREILGQGSRFNELLELNKGRLPLNVGHLTPLPVGMQIELPAN